ncbi:hypothetical protein ACERII_20270 [Evansella sp. AB-rgal1]|uniref:hypothetical protein n=1 Tax=Evansella sp. AB-rgal1 TaxID=3242696 RepID=UPI00359DF943
MAKDTKKKKRKYSRSKTSSRRMSKQDSGTLTLYSMFDKFMIYKETESLTDITLNDYHKHIRYLLEYTGGDLPSYELNLELFSWFYWVHDT